MDSSQKTRKAINSVLQIRTLLVLSWIHTMMALIPALVVQFSGCLTQNPPQLALVMFNTSEIGLSAYHNASSPLHDNLRALVPSNAEDPSSITEYLGIFDWYSMSFYWKCCGYYKMDNNTQLFTNKLEFTRCERMRHGDTFSLRDRVGRSLDARVKLLANEIPESQYNTGLFSSRWLVGCLFALLNFIVLPFSFRRHKLLGKGHRCTFSIGIVLIAFCFFLVGCLQYAKLPDTRVSPTSNLKGKSSRECLLLVILSTVSIFFSLCLGIVGWGVGAWLEDSMPLATPEDLDAEQDEAEMIETQT